MAEKVDPNKIALMMAPKSPFSKNVLLGANGHENLIGSTFSAIYILLVW